LKDHSDPRAKGDDVHLRRVDVVAVEVNRSPGDAGASIKSFMRLMQRSNVVLPQPDGPMNAVTARGGISNVTL
jgi:hypothetical protein